MLCTGAWADTNLQALVDDATAGSTVTLEENVTLSERVNISKNLTVDLGGYTITTTTTCTNGSAFNIVSGNVTIQNGTIDASFGEGQPNTETDAITARSGSDVTLKELNITVKSKNGACAYAFDGSHITIESGVYKNLTTEQYDWNPNFKALIVNQANVATKLITILGGTFVGQDPSAGDDSGLSNTFLPANLATQKNADGNFVIVNAVAKIGDKGYATLANAIAAVPTDGTETTITMLEDVDLTAALTVANTKNIILDLNGKTIKNDASKILAQLITVNGKLTINDSSIPSIGVIKNTASAKYVIKTGSAASILTLNNGTIETTTGNGNGAVYGTYGTFVMTGGKIIAEGVGIDSKNVTINGGTITSNSNDAIYANSGEYNITGGTITGGSGKKAINVYTGKVMVLEAATLNTKIGFAAAATGLILPGTAEKHIDNTTANLEIYNGETLLGYATAFTTGYVGSTDQTIKLRSDIASNNVLKIRASKLDLNGHNLSTTAAAAIATDGRNSSNMCNLTITGDGNVSSSYVAGCNAVQVGSYANVTIEGGNYYVPGDNAAIYIASSITAYPSTINITGGYYETGDCKWVLNCKDDAITKNAKIIVTGGEFKNFDPANSLNDGNTDGNGTNYVPDGYISDFELDGEGNKIYTVKVGQWIAKIEGGVDSKFRFTSLDNAITTANGASKDVTITLLSDATATVNPSENVTIDADGKALTLPTFIVSDGNAPTYAKVINATEDTYMVTTATYNRTGAVGTQWGTVCLPFSFETKPVGYTLYTPSEVTADVLTVNEVSYPVAAGTPVIFYKDNTDEVVITSSNSNIKIGSTPINGSASLSLIGTYESTNITDNLSSIYYINSDLFHQAKVNLTVPAYRAYIKNSATGAKASVLNILVGDEATSINMVNMENESVAAIYDANGIRLSSPKKGMNIMKLANGKTVKLIIK